MATAETDQHVPYGPSTGPRPGPETEDGPRSVRATLAAWADSATFRWMLPLIAVGLGLPIADGIEGLLPASTIFLVIVVLVAWYGRLAPGLLAALCATLMMDYFFIEPIYTLDLGSKVSSALIVFALSAIVVGWASANRRRAQDELKRARYETEQKVIERTVDLRRTNARLEAEIVERKLAQREVEHLAGRLIHAQEEERSRIGRELHDHISQRLGLLTIKIDQLRVDPEITAGPNQALDELRQQTSEITTDVHRLSHRLHSSMLDYLGLAPALQRLVIEVSERHGIEINWRHETLPAPPSSDIALCLFRIAEEGLNNMVKHSRAHTARVDLSSRDGAIRLVVEDSGAGFDPKILEIKAGLGFISMRERLRLVRGTIRVQSAPGRGTRIEAWVPTSDQPVGDDEDDDVPGSTAELARARRS